MSNFGIYFVYFGNHEPQYACAFVDLVVERLSDSTTYMLSNKELIRINERL